MNEQTIEEALADLPLGPIKYFDRIGSTNEVAMRWAESGAADLSLVIADEQTAGRGRLNRPWFTPPGAALAFSLVLKPAGEEIHPDQTGLFPTYLTALGSLAITDALEKRYHLKPQIKWPNDILVRGKKLAGVLVETIWFGNALNAAIMGIGINVKARSIPPDDSLTIPATCVESASGQKIERVCLLKDVLLEIVTRRAGFHASVFLQNWESRLAFRGEWVNIVPETENLEHPQRSGQVIGLAKDGSLVLRRSDGQHFHLRSGKYRIEAIRTGR